jgi:hypothetical protein
MRSDSHCTAAVLRLYPNYMQAPASHSRANSYNLCYHFQSLIPLIGERFS